MFLGSETGRPDRDREGEKPDGTERAEFPAGEVRQVAEPMRIAEGPA